MTWNNPTDLVKQNTVLTASILNSQIRDNQLYLAQPGLDEYLDPGSGGDYTTTSADAAKISANFDLSVTTTGGLVMGLFCGVVGITTSGSAKIDMYWEKDFKPGYFYAMSGTIFSSRYKHPVTVVKLWPDIPAGTHTFELHWVILSGGTATLYAANKPYFAVWEI